MSKNQRNGFAIPGAILAVIVMSVTVAAGFAVINSERRGVDDQKAQVSAFVLAEQGLETFFVRRDSLGFTSNPPGPKEGPGRITMKGGYADVQLDRIRLPLGSLAGLYLVRSRGVQTGGAIAGTPAGVRTVAQYAEWRPAPMNLLAGWTAVTGVQINGATGSFRGSDACGDSTALPGIALAGGLVTGLTGLLGLSIDGVTSLGTTSQEAATRVKVKWRGITDGSILTPMYTIPSDPIPSFADTSFYPTIRVVGNLGPNSALSGGRGLLIVTGDLGGNGGTFNWKGIVLVGGTIRGNFTSSIDGAIISSLNVKLGQTVAINVAEGTKNFRYDSCQVTKALKNLGALVPFNNAWVDNWVEY